MFAFKTVFVALAAVLALAGPASAAIQSTFDGGAEGWTGQHGDLQWLATGGQPGGHLRQSDTDGGDQVVFAPAAYLGNLSAYLGGSVAFDILNANADLPDYGAAGILTLRNGGLSVSFDLVPDNQPVADGAWHHYSAALVEANFGSDLAAVLANVTEFSLNLEFHNGITEVAGLDNFVIAEAQNVPEPGSLALLAAALGCAAFYGRRSSKPRVR